MSKSQNTQTEKKKKRVNFSVTFANGEKETLEIDNYCFTRINKLFKLKRQIKEIIEVRDAHAKEIQSAWIDAVTGLFSGTFFSDISRNNDIENYWSAPTGKVDLKEDYKKDHRVFFIVILQRTFRIWIFLSRLRKAKRSERLTPKTYAGETQTKEQKEEIELKQSLIQKQIQNKKKLAAKFCRNMVEGKYKDIRLLLAGQSNLRDSPLFKFSADKKAVETTIGTYDLSRIYDVQIGLTYQSRKMLRLQDDRCLHIKMTGNKTLEIEAKSTEDASQLFTGFKVLRNCLMSMHSFVIVDGIPRRLVATAIENLIQDGQHFDTDDRKSVNSDSLRMAPIVVG